MDTVSQILEKTSDISQFEGWLQHAVYCSPYLKRVLLGDCTLLDELKSTVESPYTREAMLAWLNSQFVSQSNPVDEATLKRILRKLRQRVMARLIVRDLNGLADLFEVTRTMSLLAEVVVNVSIEKINALLVPTYGQPIGNSGQTQHMIVVGMGKLGGNELNVSSDIDLIFAYEEEGETDGAKTLSNQEYFIVLAKKLIAVLDESTEHGFVFRVDMRLRPFGSEGVLVSSLDALENYYQNHGREWERYAWIKGRVIAGPEKLITQVLKPFVYRKYLDYSMFASMRNLKLQIQQEVDRQDRNENIKLGRGGIREIEFIAQVFQLIRGGQDQSLQIRPTLDVLSLLTQKQLMDVDVYHQLHQSYVFLRNLEHRLQYYSDAQTHDLPKIEAHQAIIASAMNTEHWDALKQKIDEVRTFVASQFAEVFRSQQSSSELKDTLTAIWFGHSAQELMHQQLLEIGYQNPQEALESIAQFRLSHKIKHLPEMSRKRLDEQMPNVIELCGKYYNANETLMRMIRLLETICRRASYLAFFVEYPHVLARVVTLVSASPWLANYLTQHPILLDSLLEDHAYTEINLDAAEQDVRLFALELRLQAQLNSMDGDTERQMNTLREFQQSRLFALACEDVINHIPLPQVSSYLSDLADLILRVVIKVVWPTIKGRHREEPAFAIIAYGKHGGRELGYSSDLDLVFLYEDEHPDARDVYSRLGMRIIAWLNTMTSSGIVYEIDMQLRPDGSSGLLVTSIDSFAEYQREKAWVWEHQAITRARFAAGNDAIGRKFEQIRIEVITRSRDLQALRLEILNMRKRMKGVFKYVPGRFDVKQGLGGMIDIEFIVQYLVLAYASSNPRLCENRASIHILRLCSVLGLIPPELGMKAAEAYQDLRKEQHAMRLQGYQDVWIPEDSMKKQSDIIRTLWRKVFHDEDA